MTCHHRLTWNTDWRCFRRGLLLGHCVEHALDHFRWTWALGILHARLDLSAINRPYINIDDERPIHWVEIGFGTDGCDPVISFGAEWGKA